MRVRFTLRNLCIQDTKLNLTGKPATFINKSYALGSRMISMKYDMASMYTLTPNINCGNVLIKFFSSVPVASDGSFSWAPFFNTLVFSVSTAGEFQIVQ